MIDAIIDQYPADMEAPAMCLADKLELKGHRQGRAWQIVEQLEYRFGSLPDPVEDRIFTGSDQEVARWALRLLDATTLDEVFTEP